MLLAICLIGWRVSSRIEQYHPTVGCAEHQAQVTFFDANERNIAWIDASRSTPHIVARHTGSLLPADLPKLAIQRTYTSQWEAKAALPPDSIDSVSLFPNPPPSSLT
jgi:hypothetical protein